MTKTIDEVIDSIDALIGDTPVSHQLSVALNNMASKDHTHDECVPREEFNELKKIVDQLVVLVGDRSVAEQISMAVKGGIK